MVSLDDATPREHLLPAPLSKWLRMWPLFVIVPYVATLAIGMVLAWVGVLETRAVYASVVLDIIYPISLVLLLVAGFLFVRSVRLVPPALTAVRAAAIRAGESETRFNAEVLRYLRWTESRWRHVVLIVVAVGVVILVTLQLDLAEMESFRSAWPHLLFWLSKWVFGPLLWAYGISLAVWYTATTVMFFTRLPLRLKLWPRLGDPDGCGGLRPVGTACLWNASPFILAAAFLAAIAYGFRPPPNANFVTVILHSGPAKSVRLAAEYLLVSAALPVALITLLAPIVATHLAMNIARDHRLRQFGPVYDRVLQRLEEAVLREDYDLAKQARNEFDLVCSVGPTTIPSPLWPIDWKVLAVVAGPQVMGVIVVVVKWLAYSSL